MLNIISRIFLVLLFLSINFLCYSGTILNEEMDHKYVEYGAKYKCVFVIMGKSQDGKLFSASCVVIDKNIVVTAAHVVENAENIIVINQDKKGYLITKATIHEDFSREKVGGNDIALCYSPMDIELDYYPKLYKDNDEQTKVCGISGHGITGTFKTGAKIYDKQQRAGSNIVAKIENEMLICNAPKSSNDPDITQLEFLIAIGDSGGGLFIDKKLAGINSCVIAKDGASDSSYGDESGHTRISKHYDWIIKNAKNLKTPIENEQKQ